jgi:hypothetical protein
VVNVGPAAPGLAREPSRLDEVERTAAPGRWTRRPESTPMLRPASSPPHVPFLRWEGKSVIIPAAELCLTLSDKMGKVWV